MILLYPVVLGIAFAIVRRRRNRVGGGSGWRWFHAWGVAGALFTFSFLTGLSIGLFLLPVATLALLWVARRAPNGWEWLGFVEGIGFAFMIPWPTLAVVLVVAAPGTYAALRLRLHGRRA